MRALHPAADLAGAPDLCVQRASGAGAVTPFISMVVAASCCSLGSAGARPGRWSARTSVPDCSGSCRRTGLAPLLRWLCGGGVESVRWRRSADGPRRLDLGSGGPVPCYSGSASTTSGSGGGGSSWCSTFSYWRVSSRPWCTAGWPSGGPCHGRGTSALPAGEEQFAYSPAGMVCCPNPGENLATTSTDAVFLLGGVVADFVSANLPVSGSG